MPVAIPINAGPKDTIIEFLKDTNDSPEMNVNGSVTPVEFYYNVTQGHNLLVTSFNVIIGDTKVDPQDFGGQPALANGLQLLVVDTNGRKIVDLFGGEPVKENWQWGHLVGTNWFVDRGSKTEVLTAELGLAASNIVTSLTPGQRIIMTVRDDLSALAFMQATITGFYYRAD